MNKYNIPINIGQHTFLDNSIDHYWAYPYKYYQRILYTNTLPPAIRTGIRLELFVKY